MGVAVDQPSPGGASRPEHKASAGRYLTFQLGSECYGVEILRVQEIIGLLSITKVPQTAAYVRGVINLRGRVIPVVELRRRFGLDSTDDTERTCIIVVQVDHKESTLTLGVLVDEVDEVVEVSQEQIEAPPSFGASTNTDFLLGMARLSEQVVLLLDINQTLTLSEMVVGSGRSGGE